jgi:hypothetical protein
MLEIEARRQRDYHPAEDELRTTDEGRTAANRGEFAADDEAEAVFAKDRRT